ncbi:MAG: hypothetical protein JXN63_08270 [Candidatus Delongbacteria bacterium]|nr:hypothetical protein [Candidatus Delongbacteria bacterium]
MSFLKNIFAKDRSYRQSDNRGTYHNSAEIATAYWVQRNTKQKFEPYLLYKFKDETDAVKALLDSGCVKLAEDTQELICTEVLIYGYYPVENEEYEAILCGEEMSVGLFIKAKKSFLKNNGIKINEKEPDGKEQLKKKKHGHPELVKFVKEQTRVKMGHTFIYRMHKGPDAASAVAFLEKNPVQENMLYIIVETPEGNYGRDIQGIYKE